MNPFNFCFGFVRLKCIIAFLSWNLNVIQYFKNHDPELAQREMRKVRLIVQEASMAVARIRLKIISVINGALFLFWHFKNINSFFKHFVICRENCRQPKWQYLHLKKNHKSVRYLNVQWHFQEPQLGGQTVIRVIFQRMRGIYNNHTTTIYSVS